MASSERNWNPRNWEQGGPFNSLDATHLKLWVLEARRGNKCDPVGIRSLVGWTILGPTQNIGDQDSVNVNVIRLEGHNDDKIRLKQVEKFWTTDFVDSISSTKVPVSREGKQALRIMEGSSKFVSGHYQIALPWRKQPPHLPNNKLLAVQRLQLVKKNFFVIPNYLKATRALFMTTSQRTTPNEYLKKSWVPMANLSGIFYTMLSSILIGLGNREWRLTAQLDA